jgi:ABC-type Fe3+/spermidine/putrescine transport system ATPase subunit
MGEPAVELVNVTKRFDEVIAVDNVSLRIEPDPSMKESG